MQVGSQAPNITTEGTAVGAPDTSTPPPAAAAASTPPPAASTGGTPASSPFKNELPTDWYSNLPEDIRDEPALRSYTDMAGLARSLVHSQKAIGANKVVVPSKHATAEDWRQFFHKVGLPEKVEDYKIEYSKDQIKNEGLVNDFRTFAHQEGLMPKQAAAALNFFAEREKAYAIEQKNQFQAQIDKWNESLKKDWGPEYDANLAKVKAAVTHVGDPALTEWFNTSGMGSNPSLVKAFAKLGELLSEDAIRGSTEPRISEMKEIDEKIQAMESNMEHPIYKKNHPNHGAALKERDALYAKKFSKLAAEQPKEVSATFSAEDVFRMV